MNLQVIKIARGHATAKYLLKYHYKPLLPEAITSKKKQGGFAPMPLFFKDDRQRTRIADFILSSSVVGDYLNRKTVERFVRRYDLEVHNETSQDPYTGKPSYCQTYRPSWKP